MNKADIQVKLRDAKQELEEFERDLARIEEKKKEVLAQSSKYYELVNAARKRYAHFAELAGESVEEGLGGGVVVESVGRAHVQFNAHGVSAVDDRAPQSKTATIIEVLQGERSGMTPKEIRSGLQERNVQMNQKHLYNVLFRLKGEKRILERDGKYFAPSQK